ncbi:MAG: ABC transporter ATPase [Bacteroidetes bacterium]|nr:ABC transporter ATPase [Bacteroidota bacterium]
MSLTTFEELPDDARLWLFHAERPLNDSEAAVLRSALEHFLEGWAAHRQDLTAAYDLRYNQFILLGIDESKLPPSGCSIDSMMHTLEQIGDTLAVDLVDAPDVPYRDGEAVVCVSRDAFAKLAASGTVNAATIVFDRMVTRVRDVRSGRWETPARSSWHARAFDLGESVSA